MTATRLFLCALLGLAFGTASAEKISDIRATKHNFSATEVGRTTGSAPSRNVVATSQTEVCVFCHTPHHSTTAAPAPLWNRELGATAYTPYTSSTLDAEVIRGQALAQPGGSSKLCLSCHDGTLAIGNVNVQAGQTDVTFAMTGTAGDGTMPAGQGASTGFTRDLGTDLTNDHPISLTYDSTLASRDGELRPVDGLQRWPGDGSILGVRSAGFKPEIPLEPTGGAGEGQVQCASCHDPHLFDTQESTKGPQKFLRQNRFQEAQPTDTHNPDSDIICLSCHDKNQGNGSWAFSVHANQITADETYKTASASLREFPTGQPVWKAACLNCHDTHTVQGARRLLREGTDSVLTPKSGGNPALEETCYQCHTTSALSVVNSGNGTVPDIRTDFNLSRHMPIRSSEQPANEERHDISSNFSDAFINCTGATTACGKDFLEPRTNLGVSNLTNRHAECTDCHNPHRIIRNSNGLPGALTQTNTSSSSRATHDHTAPHSNTISGALRGQWGVEPIYGGSSFFALPSSYTVKRGDPGTSTSTAASESYVTREYQICLKCHSDYGYTDDNFFPNGSTRPRLDSATSLSGTNANGHQNFDRYTNQAREFQPNSASGNTGADSAYSTNNVRSWHPVVGATGRNLSSRGISGSNPWLSPFTSVGTQTMYCSDCHGSSTSGNTVDPGSNPWGPHGSTNNFILKGVWDNDASGSTSNMLCLKCHNSAVYNASDKNAAAGRTGFRNGSFDNLHGHHRDKIGQSLQCTWCHVAVPHGWKNKMFLVNLNDIGAEAGQSGSKEVAINNSGDYYSNGPYYLEAKNKIRNFANSGNWGENDCGSSSKGAADRINSTNGNSTNRTGSGKDWMRSMCQSPP
ncbi:MAG: hypothetical protein KDG55_01405 [Rhodocyclaceae bacterium]|nr:hypothetical protein [Rhodocyclaceae bacterium]